jgi:hypothetical protein
MHPAQTNVQTIVQTNVQTIGAGRQRPAVRIATMSGFPARSRKKLSRIGMMITVRPKYRQYARHGPSDTGRLAGFSFLPEEKWFFRTRHLLFGSGLFESS